MQNNQKIKISISTLSILILTILIYHYYKNYPEVILKSIYNRKYVSTLDSCQKWNGTFSTPPEPSILINRDTNFIYLSILLDKYKTFDFSLLRDGEFCDVCDDSMRTIVRAADDAERDYLKQRYGKDFQLLVRKQASMLNIKYRISYYENILKNIENKIYKEHFINDSIQVGIVDKTFLDSIPFTINISALRNKKYYNFQEQKDKLIFTANGKCLENGKYMLPTIGIVFHFDSLKTDFPYCKYPFKEVYLDYPIWGKVFNKLQ
jgi:hypothetical protein